MKSISVRRSVLLAISCAGIAASACKTASTAGANPISGATVAANASGNERATLEGRVDPKDAGSISDLRVNVYRVKEDGSGLESLAKDQVKTDAHGRYKIHLNVPASAMINILIVADRPDTPGRGMAVVPSWSVVDGVIIAPTIDLETAVESDIYLAAAKQGVWVPTLGTNELRTLVSERLAQGLRASKAYKRDIAVMAQASVAAIQAWYQTLLDPSNGLDPTQVEAVFEAMAWAQVALDAQIYSAETANDVQEALAIHSIAVSAAYASVGVGPEHLALAGQAAADNLRRFAHAMSPEMRSMLISEAESLRARYVIGAVDSLMSKAGSQVPDRDVAKDAGARLAGKLALAAESENPDEFVRSAWQEYQEAVQGQLESIARSGEDKGEERPMPPQPRKEEVI